MDTKSSITTKPQARKPPKFLKPDFELMPRELKRQPNWVLWSPVWTGTKWTKRPIQPSGFGASTTNPKHWGSFVDVKRAYECAVERGYMEAREKDKPLRRVPIGGVGFVFDGQPDENGLVFGGVDFDKAITSAGINPFPRKCIKRLGSYTEWSVSGNGLHVIAKVRPLLSGVSYKHIEMYTSGRFFTMTGQARAGVRITAAPKVFAALAAKLRAAATAAKTKDRDISSSNTKEHPPKTSQTAGQTETGWYSRLPVERRSEVVKYAALHIAKNSKLFELTKHGGNYNEYLRLAFAIARSAAPDAEEIFVEAASTVKEADPDDKLRKFFQGCAQAKQPPDGTTVATLLHVARQCGAQFQKWKALAESRSAVSLSDFYAYMPMHRYIFAPSRELWPASSVNSRLGPVDEDKPIPASAWLDENRPVEQMTWAPGLPMLIRDRLISEGGWIKRPGVSCFNLYRPPRIKLGNSAQAQRWLDHIHKVFGDDDEHIVRWLAHRRQHPRRKINHALVLGGSQGIGKDTALEPAKYAVGPWNFLEVSPQHLLGPFNGFAKSVILRVSEARDLGGVDRFRFYDHLKTYTAAPPDVLRVNEKNLREHYVINCCGIIITTNHKTDGIYLPSDDRRHFVSWSNLTKDDFDEDYWNDLWGWYRDEGIYHVAAYLAQLDISSFDPKAPPPKTQAFWDIVAANTAPEDAELADVLDKMDNPDAVTINQIANHATGSFQEWINDRRNCRAFPHRLEKCGYVQVRNNNAKDGLWVIDGSRHVVYARSDLSAADRLKAASELARGEGWSVK